MTTEKVIMIATTNKLYDATLKSTESGVPIVYFEYHNLRLTAAVECFFQIAHTSK